MIANALSGGGFNGRRRMPHVIENHGHAPRIALFGRSSSLWVDHTADDLAASIFELVHVSHIQLHHRCISSVRFLSRLTWMVGAYRWRVNLGRRPCARVRQPEGLPTLSGPIADPPTRRPATLDTGPFEVHSGEPAPGLGILGIWPVAPAAGRPRRCEAVAGCTPAPAPGLPSASQTPPRSGAHPSASLYPSRTT